LLTKNNIIETFSEEMKASENQSNSEEIIQKELMKLEEKDEKD